MTHELRDSLQFHSLLAVFVGPRQVQVLQAPLPPLRIYSDASYDLHADVVAGIGFVLFDAAASCPPIGMAGTLEPHVLGLFEQRHQQITPCEALLSVIVPHNLGSRMAGRDILWYIDNQAACQILTIGSSSQSDLCFISSLAHLLFARLNCRIFWEYIESDANPSDGLSRRGLLDEWDGQTDPLTILMRVHDEVRAPLLAARSAAYIDELGEFGDDLDDPEVKTTVCQ